MISSSENFTNKIFAEALSGLTPTPSPVPAAKAVGAALAQVILCAGRITPAVLMTSGVLAV